MIRFLLWWCDLLCLFAEWILRECHDQTRRTYFVVEHAETDSVKVLGVIGTRLTQPTPVPYVVRYL